MLSIRAFALLCIVVLVMVSPCACALATDADGGITALAAQNEANENGDDDSAADLPMPEAEEPPEQADTPIDPGELPDFVPLLLAVAAAEIGYTEGANNLTKYGEWAGDPNAQWCAEFVCWSVDQTDQLYQTTLLESIYPNYSSQNTGRDWFIKRGRFVYRRGNCPGWGYQWLRGADHILRKNEYIPRPGDLMFFSYNAAGDTEHVALVEYSAYDAQGNVMVHVIEGNNPSSVQRNRYALNNSQVLGFGTAQDVVDTTMRSGCVGDKVLQLQQWLHRLGFLEEQHLTGSFGSNTRAAVVAYQQTMEGKTANGLADRVTQQAIEAAIIQLDFETPENWLVAD